MRVYSDTLTKDDFYEAVQNAPSGVGIYELSGPLNARKRRQRFELYLEGNSAYLGQRGGQAATWDEWGLVLAELFRRDENMAAGSYDGIESFRQQTQDQRDHVAQNSYYRDTPHGRRAAKYHKAPWLHADGSFRPSPWDFSA